jgi:hypothetical protein
MKLLDKINSRNAILAGLIIAETFFIYHYFHHHNLELFSFMTTAIVLLFVTFYWFGWLVRRRVTNFEVCVVIGIGAWALDSWHKGDRALSIIVASAGIFFVMILLRRLLSPIDIDQQEVNLSAYRAEANSLSPIKRHTLSIIAYTSLGVVVWALNGFIFPRYANFLFLLAIWEVFVLIYLIIRGKRKVVVGNRSIESTTNPGGRA